MATKTVVLEIKRQANPDAPAVWEKFELEWRPGMNVISAMMEIAANPVTADGRATTPITYDSNCLEEICGSCAMRINGKARMACSSLVDNLEQPIKVEPLSKFPLVRDLQVAHQRKLRERLDADGLLQIINKSRAGHAGLAVDAHCTGAAYLLQAIRVISDRRGVMAVGGYRVTGDLHHR